MRLIKSSFKILGQEPGIQGIYKQIELAGRLSYKSEDKITEDSAKKFVDTLIKKGHTSCLEHGTVYLWCHDKSEIFDIGYRYELNPFSKVVWGRDKFADITDVFVTTNYRVIYENDFIDDLKYLCEPMAQHENRISVRFVLPISISREFCRHRVFSFMEQSSRYCNYNANKFNSEITFIIPYWTNLQEARYKFWDNDWVDATDQNKIPDTILKSFVGDSVDIFLSQCESAEVNYKALINRGCKAQEAREILPLCTKTELIMTGTIEQWRGFFVLRDAKSAHPQAHELAHLLHVEFIHRGYLSE